MVALAELVSIDTDTVPLDGLYYAPQGGQVRGGVLFMHGNGMNFYYGVARFLPQHLVAAGFACLAFNRRGHDTLSSRTRDAEGNAFQTAAEAQADNEYARGFLRARGHAAPIVIGHSNGGVFATRFVATHPETPALVLLSAHRGGRDVVRQASARGLMAGDRLAEISDRAQALVAAGRPDELLLMPGWWYVTSAGSFVDRQTNTPSLLGDALSIRCPTLFLRGDAEDQRVYPAEEFQATCPADVAVHIVSDCDHFYTGHDADVGALVADWLRETVTATGAGTTAVVDRRTPTTVCGNP